MGTLDDWFGETVTQVATSVSRVFDPTKFMSTTKKSLIESLFEDSDLVDILLDNSVQSIGATAERMYRYAQDHYAYGMPTGSTHSSVVLAETMDPILEAIEGQPIQLDYAHLTPPNYGHIIWTVLLADSRYTLATNTITVPVDGVTQLDSLILVLPTSYQDTLGPRALETWPAPNTPGRMNFFPLTVEFDAAATQPYARIRYTWLSLDPFLWEGTTATYTRNYGSFTLELPEYDLHADYLHTRYVCDGQLRYFLYRIGEGTYPSLDQLTSEPFSDIGTYFPIVHFRQNRTSLDTNPDSVEYKTSAKLMKYLGLNYQHLIDAVHENPGIADIEQAIMTFAVSANTTEAIEQRYLFDYFSRQYLAQPEHIVRNSWGYNNTTGTQGIVIRDTIFKMTLAYDGISRKIVRGSIGTVGSYASEVTHWAYTYPNPWAGIGDVPVGDMLTMMIPTHHYRKQLTETLYEEVSVDNLQMRYEIAGSHWVVASDAQNILLIPLDHSITEHYSMPDRERLYSYALYFVFNAFIETQVHWYESDFFQFIMTVVTVTIAIVTLQPEFAALAAGTVTLEAFVITMALKIIEGLVIAELFKLFVKLVGGDLALLIAVAAVAFGAYTQLESGNFSQLVPTAKEMLMVANGLTHAVSAEYAEKGEALLEDANAFTQMAQKETSLLEGAQKLLANDNWMTPFVLWGESPDDYFLRTAHNTNPGILSLSMVSQYVDLSLQLPKLSERYVPMA